MIEYVYMIRNGALYNIGRTDNISLIKKQLKPGVLIASLKTEDSKEFPIQKEPIDRFKYVRNFISNYEFRKIFIIFINVV